MTARSAVRLASILSCLAVPLPGGAQDHHLSGTLELSTRLGYMRGDFCVDNLEPADTVTFTLYRGLEPAIVRAGPGGETLDYTGYYDGQWAGEGLLYNVAVPPAVRPLRSLCVSYTGAVPSFETNDAGDDWKGRIVATRGTLRATEQAKWYPIIQDRASGALSTIVTYDLTVNCPDCRRIYVNGSPVEEGPVARFRSDTPRPLMLFAGQFDVAELEGLAFAGGPVDAATAAAFRADVDAIASSFESFIDVPYGGTPVFLTFASVARRRSIGRTSWAFVTWPTVAFDGAIDFKTVVDTAGGSPRLPAWLQRTLSHELAHYYFGTVLRPTGNLRWFYLESMAEYMSLRYIGVTEGDSALAARAAQLREGALRAGDVIPLDRISHHSQIRDSYRYQLAPLWLLQLQRLAGEPAMGRLLNRILMAPPDRERDWQFFLDAAARAGIARDTLDRWVRECLRAPVASGCAAQIAVPGN